MEKNRSIVLTRRSDTGREVAIEHTTRRTSEKSPLTAYRHGSLSTMQLYIPAHFLDIVPPPSPVLSRHSSDEEFKSRASPSPSMPLSLGNNKRSIGWLRRLIHEFLSEVSKRPVFVTEQYVGANEYHDSRLVSSNSYYSASPPSAGLSSSLDLRRALLSFLRARWGTDALLRQVCMELLRAIQHHRNSDVEVQLISSLLSCKKYDGMDIKLFVQSWAKLRNLSHLSRTDGGRYISAGQLWRCASACLGVSCLPSEVRLSTSNRVKNTIDRWFRESPPGSVAIPNTEGHPHLFSLPYSLYSLQMYIGASVSAPSGAGVAPRAVENQPVTDAHVLALILLNAKMERVSPHTQECVRVEVTKEHRTLTAITSQERSVKKKDSHSLPARAHTKSGNVEVREEDEDEDDEVECWVDEVEKSDVGSVDIHCDREAHTIEPRSDTISLAQNIDELSSPNENTNFQKEIDDFGKLMAAAFEYYETVRATQPL